MTTRQYGRLVDEWIVAIGLSPAAYGTHSLRRTKAALIYRKTGNIRAVQLLLGHTKLDSTVRYLGVEVEDALAIAEGIHGSVERRLPDCHPTVPVIVPLLVTVTVLPFLRMA